jgi:hypothetical protein
MKKILLTIAAAGLTVGAFAQGTVILENSLGSGNVTLNSSAGPLAAAGSYQVALLWFNGTSFVQEGAVYQTSTGNNDGAGFFNGETVTVPTFTASPGGTFEVEGWTGNFANYAAAVAGGAHVGLTASFVNNEGNPAVPTSPVAINGGTPAGGWNGNLVLIVPEPTTIALGGLGAAALLLFRRRK